MNRPTARNALKPADAGSDGRVRGYEFRDTKDHRVAIRTGAGDEDFSAGGDLKLTMPVLVTGARKPRIERDTAWSPISPSSRTPSA